MLHARLPKSMPDFSRENALREAGIHPVAGLDEAGRGPLAGSIVACAVILAPDAIPAGLDDSKRLSARQRESLYDAIMAQALGVGVGVADVAHIEAVNILQANFAAMRAALHALCVLPRMALIDGRDVPPDLPCPAQAIIRGDGLSQSIAAASIIAKVTRDRMMDALDKTYPAYGFARHKGYGTKAHRSAIFAHGLCPAHRRSFCKKLLEHVVF